MTKIGLEFLPNIGGEGEGLSDAGIETFRDKPFAAVARETGQNSRDARANANQPVRVTFDVVTMKSSDFCSIAGFRSAAKLCHQKAKKSSNEKEKGFFEHAVRTLDAAEIKILRISDFNTKGVRGPCEEGRPFHTLAKTDGVSVKEDLSSGGSFGIGKNAVFALSDIQTAFFSTKFVDDDGRDQVLCMGKALFISHTGDDGMEKRRKGYWGKTDGYMPLDNPREIPAWLLRESQGTSIFSIGMRSNRTDWRYEMTAAILINFFCAIERQEMEFEIDNGFLKINRNTLQNLFQDSKVNEAVNQLNARIAFDAAKTLHACLVDDKTTIEVLEVKELGKIRMRVLLREGLGYTIGIIRNGMYITDNLAHFNEPFKRFPLHRDFAVIIEPAGQTEGEWFKRLENPRHDDLSAERVTDPQLREQGERAFVKLAKQIRDRIRELAKSEPTGTVELDELSDFFASDTTRQDDDEGPETDPRSLKPTPIKRSSVKSKPTVWPNSEDEDQPPGPGPEPGPGPIVPGPPHPVPPGPTPRPQPQAQPIILENERNLIPDTKTPQKRRVFFTSPVSGSIVLYTEATGLSTPDRLGVRGVSGGTAKADGIEVTCIKGQRVILEVEFDAPYVGPIETSAFLVTPVEEAAR